jgi:hypothetical protein
MPKRIVAKQAKEAPVSVVGTKLGVIVTGVNAAHVRKALKLIQNKRPSSGPDNVIKLALKIYRMNEKFFASGGRFKRPYKRKKKAKAKPTKADKRRYRRA